MHWKFKVLFCKEVKSQAAQTDQVFFDEESEAFLDVANEENSMIIASSEGLIVEEDENISYDAENVDEDDDDDDALSRF